MRKKRRYQVNCRVKLSNTLRNILILFGVAMIAISSGCIIKSFTNKTEIISNSNEIYKYNNEYNCNSKINLKENKYIHEDEIMDDQAYLSDLISNIDMNLKYEYKASRQSKLVYDYKIEAIVNAVYSDTKNTYDVLNKSEVLKEEKDIEIDSKDIKIDEIINVNYAKYHQMVREFKQSLGINTDSYLYIKLTVNTKTDINSKEVKNQYVSNYKITLGDKIAVVDEKKHEEKSESIKGEVYKQEKTDVDYNAIILNAILMIIGIIWLRIILKKTEALRSIRNEFKVELNKIMKSYEDKIVEIQDLNNIDIENATRVKDVMQLRKLAEEALVPIYCYVKEDINDQKAYFIVTKYENSYIYILK